MVLLCMDENGCYNFCLCSFVCSYMYSCIVWLLNMSYVYMDCLCIFLNIFYSVCL